MRQATALKKPHDDLFEERLVSDAVIAFRCTDSNTGEDLFSFTPLAECWAGGGSLQPLPTLV